MEKKNIKPSGYWNVYENCKIEALKHKCRKDFKKASSCAYNTARENKWLDDICSHMIQIRNKKGYWTKDKCQLEALKYTSRTEFKINSKCAYGKAYKNKWLDEFCNHMEDCGSLYKRLIYIAKFIDNHVYVGLTCDADRRFIEHLNDKTSQIYKHITKSNLLPVFIKITKFVDVKEAKKLEKYYIKEYKDTGYTLLNIATGGSLGGNGTTWTYKKCKNEALKYNNRKEFATNSKNAYEFSRKNKYLNRICKHMKPKKIILNSKKYGYWKDKEKCREAALKFDNITTFRKKYSAAYKMSIKYGWLDDICVHMTRKIYPIGYWKDKEKCRKVASEFTKRTELKSKYYGAYLESYKNNWLDDFFPTNRN